MNWRPAETENIRMLIETDFGRVIIELYPKQAPLGVTNFLRYVDEDRFVGACFYRAVRLDNQPGHPVKIEVIQGGLKDDEYSQRLPPIRHESTVETGLFHKHGSISMARIEPGTASSEFFICIHDQPELDFGGRRNPDGQGFAVFGQVIEGMAVVTKIQSQPAEGQYLVKDVQILLIRRFAIHHGSH